ncbi:hypothetical protein [Paenibacillus sp. NPDC093718]|uniref:hypothetical protein n=1 Tax=Paenibacillus sp. NPDC093718 TaxID=3390601 RepID=UPI003D06CCCB
MKNKLFGKLALTAALLGTAAVPVHASGADTTSDVPNQKVKGEHTKAVTMINSVPNPLELAQKYAPDTVQDWKETLAKYEKLAGAKGAFMFTEATAAVGENGAAKPDTPDGEFEVAIAVKATPAADIKELPDKGELKNFKVAMIKEVGTPLDVVTFEIGEVAKVDSSEIQHDIIHSEEASIEAVKISDEDLAFIHARIDLFKAVVSKDSDSIKEALAKLLDQYKEQIAKLEAEAK